MKWFKIVAGLAAFLVVMAGALWLGFRVNLPSFPPIEKKSSNLGSVKPPTDLPRPVERYVKAVFGGEIPVVQTAMVVGKVEVTLGGIPMPGRFKLYYQAGQAYYHYIEVGWYGLPIMKVNERFLNGQGVLEQPGSRVENDPNTDAAANLGLWAESIWMPSIWFTDPRVRWEAVDDNTARLIVPDAAPEEVFQVHFDPASGLISRFETVRYQNPDSVSRLPWRNRIYEWQVLNGVQVPALADVRWDDNPPWALWQVEQVYYNVDVAPRFNQFAGDFSD